MSLLSGAGLVIYLLTVTFAAIDWLMSIEPHWFSALFGAIILVGQALSTLCMMILMVRHLAGGTTILNKIERRYFRDVGNLMLAFTLLWAYTNYSQFMIQYSGNIAEEATWQIHRTQYGWQFFGLGNIILHFALPFLFLLMSITKVNIRNLAKLAAFLICARFIDLFFYVVPTFRPFATRRFARRHLSAGFHRRYRRAAFAGWPLADNVVASDVERKRAYRSAIRSALDRYRSSMANIRRHTKTPRRWLHMADMKPQGAQAYGVESGYETGDANVRAVVQGLFIIMVSTGVVMLAMFGMFNYLNARQNAAAALVPDVMAQRIVPPEPRLLPSPYSDTVPEANKLGASSADGYPWDKRTLEINDQYNATNTYGQSGTGLKVGIATAMEKLAGTATGTGTPGAMSWQLEYPRLIAGTKGGQINLVPGQKQQDERIFDERPYWETQDEKFNNDASGGTLLQSGQLSH